MPFIKFTKGCRVASVQYYDATTGTLELIGYGTYQGRQIPTDASVMLPGTGTSYQQCRIGVPAVQLDEGYTVYATDGRIVDELTAKQYEQHSRHITRLSRDQVMQHRREKAYPQKHEKR